MLENIKKQFEKNETAFGEPQAWVYLESNRSIEITLEQEGLEEKDYFYSVRLHCNEDEFDNEDFESTCGIIESYCTSEVNEEEMVQLLNQMLENFDERIDQDNYQICSDCGKITNACEIHNGANNMYICDDCISNEKYFYNDNIELWEVK